MLLTIDGLNLYALTYGIKILVTFGISFAFKVIVTLLNLFYLLNGYSFNGQF